MRKSVLMFWGIVMLVACATAPPLRRIQNSWHLDRPFADVWQAAIEVLPEMQITIAKTEKDSGLITSNPIDMPESGAKSDCDCRRLSITQYRRGLQSTFTVCVKKIGETTTELRMVAVYVLFFHDTGAVDITDQTTLWKRGCVSTGKMEADFYSRVLTRLKQ